MRRESKNTTGNVVKDRRSKKWQFFWWADGRRHSKTLGHFPTKAQAWDAAQLFRVTPAPTSTVQCAHRSRAGRTIPGREDANAT